MASKIQGITVEIGGDTTKLGNALQSVNDKAKSLQSELKGVNTLLKINPTNVTLLTQKQDILNQSIAECREKLNVLKSTQAQVQEQFEKGEITAEQYRDFQREIVATENKLKSLEKQAKSFGSVGAQQIAAVGASLKNVGDKITEVGKKLMPVSTGASAILVGATKSAIDFESAWTGVTKTVDGTDEQMEQIRKGLFDLSEATSSTVTDIAAVAESAGQLGIKTNDILSFTETMVKLGDSTNLSAEEAATALAKFANITNMSANDYDKLGAVIVDLGNHFATTEADIVSMSTRLAATGELTGLTEPQIMALATAMSSVGIEAEAGGSAMSKLLKKVQVAVETGTKDYNNLESHLKKYRYSVNDLNNAINKGGKTLEYFSQKVGTNAKDLKAWHKRATDSLAGLEQFSDVAGMTAEEFQKAFQEDALEALTAFISGLNDTERNGASAIAILEDMGIKDVRLSNTILSLANSSELMNDAVVTANEAWKDNTALTNEAEKRYATTQAKITQLKNTITELCTKLGEILLPVIQKIMDKAKSIVDGLSNLNPNTQKIIVSVLAFTAILSPLLIIVGKIISIVGSILTIVPKIISFIGTIKTVLSSLFSILLANPIGLIIVAIVALVATFVVLWKKCEGFRNFWIKLWENIKNACLTGLSKLKETFNKFINWIQNIPEWINTNVVEPIKNLIQAFLNIISKISEWIDINVIQPIWNKIQEFLRTIQTIVSWLNDNIIQPILSIVVPIVQKIGEIIAKIWEIITVLFGVLCQWIYENVIVPIINKIQEFNEQIAQFIQDIWNKITGYFSMIGQWFYDKFSEAREAIFAVFGIVSEWFRTKFEETTRAIIMVFMPIIQWFYDRWTDIKNIFSQVGLFFSNKFQEASNGVKNAFSGITSYFQQLWNNIRKIFTDIGIKIGEGIGNAFKSVVNKIIGFAENTINKFVRAINSAIGTINNIPGVNISKIAELNVPKLKVGMANVPYDDYLALLHKGERVLTAKENQNYSQFSNNGNNLDGAFYNLNNILGEYLPEILNATKQQKDFYLDSEIWVGATVNKYDEALANNEAKIRRGS